jgi:hypothetical protein
MPHDGWTLAHLRAASHGEVEHRNTHPFVVGNFAYIHNGVWSDYEIASNLLKSFGTKFTGETDSEVAAHYMNRIGKERFIDTVGNSGVWARLHINGSVELVKTSGDLEAAKLESGAVILASTLNSSKYPSAKETFKGWIRFDATGRYVNHRLTRPNKGFGSLGEYPAIANTGLKDFCLPYQLTRLPVAAKSYPRYQSGSTKGPLDYLNLGGYH